MVERLASGSELTAGLAGVFTNGSVALCAGGSLLAACEQQRVTRVRGAGCNATGVPDEALERLLERLGHARRDVTRYAFAEDGRPTIDGRPVERIDHHLAHASAAYRSFPLLGGNRCGVRPRGAEGQRVARPGPGHHAAVVAVAGSGLHRRVFGGGRRPGLGARSILASPFSPYVLDNLNGYLKLREPWHGYAVSALEEVVGEHFAGPARAPFMECDYRVRDGQRFARVLPEPQAAIRVHTVGRQAPRRFVRLLQAFGEVTGFPGLVNTSFNGFHEPIVCSPRDAVRVFYGSGVDLLVLDQFVLTKA